MTTPGVSFRGGLAMTNIVDLIQFLHASGKNGELSLYRGIEGEKGLVYFNEGNMVHVSEGELTGMEALIALLRWNVGQFHFTPGISSLHTTIELPVQQALMEAMRLGDEANRADRDAAEAMITRIPEPPDRIVAEDVQPTTGGFDMNTKKLEIAMNTFRDKLGMGLVGCDIWGADGLSLAGYNSNPAAVALFGEVTTRIINSLSDAGFPALGRYYLLELSDKKIVCVMTYRDAQWGAVVDMEKVNMGMLISIAIPKAIEDLRAAVDG